MSFVSKIARSRANFSPLGEEIGERKIEFFLHALVVNRL